jgi:hypothetical protein
MTARSPDANASAIHPAPSDSARLKEALWSSATTLDAFIDEPIMNQELWRTTARLARLSDAAAARARALPHRSRLLVLLEDWCGDAMFTVPFLGRIVEQNPALEMRVLRRDLHEELMDTHRTAGGRSIPVIMTFDEAGGERGWWGPRPSPLQEWVVQEGLAMEKPLRYKAIRTWYARDRGETTVHELLTMLERWQLASPSS